MPIIDLEVLSCTDVACTWKDQKAKTVIEKYEAIPFVDYPCLKKLKVGNSEQLESIDISDKKEHILNKLCSAAPSSALAKHKIRQRRSHVSSLNEEEIPEHVIKIIDHASKTELLNFTGREIEKDCCKIVYDLLIPENLYMMAETTRKEKLMWQFERKYRITASCYDLYTYSKDDWVKKCLAYLTPKRIENRFVLHGVKYEDEARQVYTNATSSLVKETGLIVAKNHPWLACSPDGVIFNSNREPTKLLEIKCPYIGREVSAEEFYKSCKYLGVNQNNEIMLKKKHKYYGQIQLGMAILNLQECDFVLYSSKFQNLLIINVKFDEEFTSSMLIKLQNVYFEHMLPQICKIKNN